MGNFDIWLSSPHMSGEEIKLVQEAFDSNWIAPLGPHVDQFEKEVAAYIDPTLHGAALSSGTAAIHLGLILLGVKAGDYVICQSLTFAGTTNPISYCGAIPVFVDSEKDSWNMDPKSLEQALEWCRKQAKPAKVVMPVNLYGQSADMDAIRELAQGYGAKILEDAAESLGATYKGKQSGSFGDFIALSFNGNKIITTSGGGMLLSRDAAAIADAKKLATQAREPAPYYLHTRIGYNYRLSNLCAAVGRGQLRVLNQRIARRREIYDCYYKELNGISGVSFIPEPSFGKSTRWLTVMLLDPKQQKLRPMDIVNHLQSKRIEARPVWKPLHSQPVYQGTKYFSQPDQSYCDFLFENGVCLPSGSNINDDKLSWVIKELKSILR